MSTDPIKLIQGLFAPKKAATTTSTASTTTSSATVTPPSTSDAYRLSQSLVNLMTQGTTGSSTTQDMANYTAQGLKDYFQAAHSVQAKDKSATTGSKPLDDVLKASSIQGTNTTTPSAAVQEILKDKKATATDAGLATIDSRLAQTVGISKAIGTA